MKFEWHTPKAQATFEAREIDFEDAARIFEVNRIEVKSSRNGEERWQTIGMLNGKCISVVFTYRGDAIRIISVRRARANEKRAYDARYPR